MFIAFSFWSGLRALVFSTSSILCPCWSFSWISCCCPHGEPVTLSLTNATIHILQLIIDNWLMMGWANVELWFCVWMVSGLVSPLAFFHLQHQGELHYFSSQLIFCSEQQEAGLIALPSGLQVLLSCFYTTRAICPVFPCSSAGATLCSAAADEKLVQLSQSKLRSKTIHPWASWHF